MGRFDSNSRLSRERLQKNQYLGLSAADIVGGGLKVV